MDSDSRETDVSIIIPCKTAESIQELIDSLRNQNYNKKYEVIQVTGGNIPQAKNKGLENANGKLIAFIDSDCLATEHWLTNLTGTIDKLNAGGVGGPGISPPGEGILSTAIDCVYNSYLGSLGSASLKAATKNVETKALSTHNCIYQKKVLTQVEGFDERYLMNEDTDLSTRVIKEGYKLYITPTAIVHHKRKKDLKTFTKKFFHYGVSRTRAMLTDSKNIDTRILALLGLLLFGIYSLVNSQIIAGILLTFYLIIIIGQSFYHAYRKQIIKLVYYIPILYVLEHLGYTCGLIWGISKGKYRKTSTFSDLKVTIYSFTPTTQGGLNPYSRMYCLRI